MGMSAPCLRTHRLFDARDFDLSTCACLRSPTSNSRHPRLAAGLNHAVVGTGAIGCFAFGQDAFQGCPSVFHARGAKVPRVMWSGALRQGSFAQQSGMDSAIHDIRTSTCIQLDTVEQQL
jgi:hypothetical protein